MVDILQYSVAKEASDLSACIASMPTTITTPLKRYQSANYNWQEILCRHPWRTDLWSCIPSLPGSPCGFKVCAGSSCVPGSVAGTYCNCGACLQWTTPVGANLVRFQLWGAGAGTGSGCCCGGSPFGATGSYISVIVPAQAGLQYTVCAACALCCFTTRTASGGNCSCYSFVTASDGCLCLSAPGGWSWVYWQNCVTAGCTSPFIGNGPGICTAAAVSDNSGWCNSTMDWCAGGLVNCGAGGGGYVQFPGFMPVPCGLGSFCLSVPCNVVAAYIPGMYGCAICTYNPINSRYGHPPIYGYETTTCCCVQGSFAGTTGGWNYNASTGYLAVPGAGGGPSMVCGGCNTNCGDMGRAGMVCISWV